MYLLMHNQCRFLISIDVVEARRLPPTLFFGTISPSYPQ
ncbi:hypothetical protein CFter6_4492 [Collimonas fungivorans]|uniref:Uncharacterized protein n=1 Tax=Collimonas fungivorans TaxID=158899 RepID=A0A127PH78_9BURK|nr:hypothetical protein CFter6_4492 [Collimonas fungivorans]